MHDRGSSSACCVLPGEGRPLLIMIGASGHKVTILSHWFENGENLKGGDPMRRGARLREVEDIVAIPANERVGTRSAVPFRDFLCSATEVIRSDR